MAELTVKELADEIKARPELRELFETARDADPEDIRRTTDALKGTAELSGKFYSVPEAAELLGLHPNTVYHMEQRREIEYYKPGKKILIPESEIERLKVERKTR